MVIGDSGIFAKAQEAKRQTNIANTKEQIQKEITEIQSNNQADITEGQLKMILENYGTVYNAADYAISHCGVRPLICLPSDICTKKMKSGHLVSNM